MSRLIAALKTLVAKLDLDYDITNVPKEKLDAFVEAVDKLYNREHEVSYEKGSYKEIVWEFESYKDNIQLGYDADTKTLAVTLASPNQSQSKKRMKQINKIATDLGFTPQIGGYDSSKNKSPPLTRRENETNILDMTPEEVDKIRK